MYCAWLGMYCAWLGFAGTFCARLWYGDICLNSEGARDTDVICCPMQHRRRVAMDSINAVSSTVSSIIDAASHDESYRFGGPPTARAPFPFTERQFARLLIARGRLQAVPSADDQPTA